MKILYISLRINSEDGSAVHGREFVKALTDLGHEVHTYPPLAAAGDIVKASVPRDLSIWQKLKSLNVRKIDRIIRRQSTLYRDIAMFVSGYLSSRGSAKKVKQVIDTVHPDLIIYRAVMYDYIANILRKRCNIPMIAEVNSIKRLEMEFSKRGGIPALNHRVEEDTYRPANAITVVSEEIRKFLVDSGVRKPIAVVSNGVDSDTFVADQAAKQALKSQYGIEGSITMGYIGSYKKWHGLDDTLRVLKAALDDGIPIKLVAIGSGEQYDAINDMLHDMALEDHVVQIPAVAHHEVSHYINLIDIAVMTYPMIENFYFSPLKMYEYLSAEIPVVASRLGQIDDVLSSADMGRLVDPGDIAGFQEAVRQLAVDDEVRAKCGQTAREWVLNNCSWKINAQKVIDVLEDTSGKPE